MGNAKPAWQISEVELVASPLPWHRLLRHSVRAVSLQKHRHFTHGIFHKKYFRYLAKSVVVKEPVAAHDF